MLKDIIRFKLHSVKPNDTLKTACHLMKTADVGCVLACTPDGKPVGILTDRDIVIRCMADHVDPHTCHVEDVMTKSPRTVSTEAGLYDCIRTMHDAGVRRIPVVDSSGKAVGIVSFGDLLKILGSEFNALIENTTHPLEGEKTAKKPFAA